MCVIFWLRFCFQRLCWVGFIYWKWGPSLVLSGKVFSLLFFLFSIIGSSDPDFRSLCSTVFARVMLGASIMCLESVCPLRFCVGSSVPGFRPLLYSAEMLGASIMCPGVFLFPFDFCVGSSDPSFRPLLSSSVFFCLLSRCSSLPLVEKSREFLISHE